jgi:D-3-phosphoglycerate dehydrogenase
LPAGPARGAEVLDVTIQPNKKRPEKMSYKILISDQIEEVLTDVFDKNGLAYDVKTGMAPDELLEAIGSYDAQVVRSATKVTAAVLAKGKAGNLKIVARAGAGLDNIDVEKANELGIKVVNTPGLNANAVAELTISYCFILARRLGAAMASIREGRWEKKSLSGAEIMGKTLGLIGFGHIGRLVAQKAHGLGMKVLAYDPVVPADVIQKFGAYPVSLETIYKEGDFVSLHLPEEDATKGLINEKVFKKLKNTAFLINCARGGLVDEAALYAALTANEIAGAAADVFSKEPPEGSPLLSLPNFAASPHIGASTIEAQLGVARRAAELIVEHLASLG